MAPKCQSIVLTYRLSKDYLRMSSWLVSGQQQVKSSISYKPAKSWPILFLVTLKGILPNNPQWSPSRKEEGGKIKNNQRNN
jgi:hypothetical protein